MARRSKFDYDIIVIGSGAAGNTTALLTSQSGKKVALVEAQEFGGESPNWGDIPTGALLGVAQLYQAAKNGSHFGLRSSMLSYNYPAMLNWRDKVRERTGAGDSKKYYQKQGIDTFDGPAHFLSPHEITVNRRHLTAEKFAIATGSHFAPADILGIDSVNYLTPQTVLNQKQIPRSLFIIGSDSIAVEYAQFFATLGSKVYISEVSARLLPNEEQEVGETLAQYFEEAHDISCLTQSQVIQVEKKGSDVAVSYNRGNITKSVQVEALLVTTHRTPNTDIGLENAKVDYSPRGIEVSQTLQTSAKHIFAAGTVTGDNQPTHVAQQQGRIVAHNLLHKDQADFEDKITPSVIYTMPSIASVGLSEDDCIKRDMGIKKAIAPLNIIPRSNTSDFRTGFVKLICDRDGKLLGGTIMAPNASEMIHEISLAIYHEMSAHDIASAPHAFLSWNEAIRMAANKLVF